MTHQLDHVGIVVEDLEAVSGAFGVLLGAKPEKRAVPEAHFEARVFRVSETEVELLHFNQPIDGVDPSVFQAGGGIQHLAFRVSDLAAALETLRDFGVEPLQGFPRPGVHGRIAFFREPVTGILLELVER